MNTNLFIYFYPIISFPHPGLETMHTLTVFLAHISPLAVVVHLFHPLVAYYSDSVIVLMVLHSSSMFMMSTYSTIAWRQHCTKEHTDSK